MTTLRRGGGAARRGLPNEKRGFRKHGANRACRACATPFLI
jgi:hypothetical protein